LSRLTRSFRTRAFFLILIWILLFLASIGLLSVLLTNYLSNPQVQSVVSLSWAGYVVASSFSSPQPDILAVNASWIIPHVNTSSTDTFSSAWIGIGGQFDKSLIQVGTEHNYDSTAGQVVYTVWYELLPAYAVNIPMNLSESDVVTASIRLANPDTNEWNIQFNDLTNGESFNNIFVYNSTRLSAEWIIERPTLNNQISNLANFGLISFTGSYVDMNHEVNSLGKLHYAKVDMTNRQNTQLTSVSSITAAGTSFNVSYSAST
jgi:hypothetical protein